MLDFDTALDLMNKYGYTSMQQHPYIYQDGDTIGICYTYVDEEFGLLERIKIFETASEMEEFLQMYNWVFQNGKNFHVRMILDNYESMNPKVMFLRNEKIMVEGEMFDIEAYDSREKMRYSMDPVSKVIYETGDLLLVYNEIKSRQLQYLKNIIALKNTLRRKYFDLQTEVDKYNKIKIERNLTLLPEVSESGINEVIEVSIKDRYNQYISVRPSYEEAIEFLKEVWDMCLALEMNGRYYEAQKEENDVRNEMKVVEEKLTLIRELNTELKPLFGIDLVSKFKKINRECKSNSSSISNESINAQMDAVNRKYSFYSQLDPLLTSDYLREATQNTNYADLAIKYALGSDYEVASRYRAPINEVAYRLSLQYRDNLSVDEQSILVLYNNPKYRLICDAILNIPNFETASIKKIVRDVSKINNFSKIKSECYDIVHRRLNDPSNTELKNSVFSKVNFSSFEHFIESLVNLLRPLKTLNERMVIDGDVNMFITVKKPKDINDRLFILTTNNINDLLKEARENKKIVGVTLIKSGTPVLYSPYYFDIGDLSKGASMKMEIKEMINFELLVDITDIIVNIDPNYVKVTHYYTVPNTVENLSVVDDVKVSHQSIFCKYAFTSQLSDVVAKNQAQIVGSNVSPVVSSVIDVNSSVMLPSTEMQPVFNNPINNEVPVMTPVVEQDVDMVPSVEVPVDNSVVVSEVSMENKEDISVDIQLPTIEDNVKVDAEEPKEDIPGDIQLPEVKEDNEDVVSSAQQDKEETNIDKENNESKEEVDLPKVEEDNKNDEVSKLVAGEVKEKSSEKHIEEVPVIEKTKLDENKEVEKSKDEENVKVEDVQSVVLPKVAEDKKEISNNTVLPKTVVQPVKKIAVNGNKVPIKGKTITQHVVKPGTNVVGQEKSQNNTSVVNNATVNKSINNQPKIVGNTIKRGLPNKTPVVKKVVRTSVGGSQQNK